MARGAFTFSLASQDLAYRDSYYLERDCTARACLGSYLLLLVAGICTGAPVVAGSVMLIGVVPALTYFLPWMKIPVCRGRFVMASVAVLAGAVAWVLIHGGSAQPVYFMIAAWMLYLPPMFMHLLVLVSLDRGYRTNEPGSTGKPERDEQVPLPQ